MVKNFRLLARPSPSLPRGMFAGVAILLLLIPTFYIMGLLWNPRPSQGLFVSIQPNVHPRTVQVSEDSLVLRLTLSKEQIHYFLNGREVKPFDLNTELVAQISKRADWAVYLDADLDISYADAVDAMDIIRNSHARVVLVTPNSRYLLKNSNLNTRAER